MHRVDRPTGLSFYQAAFSFASSSSSSPWSSIHFFPSGGFNNSKNSIRGLPLATHSFGFVKLSLLSIHSISSTIRRGSFPSTQVLLLPFWFKADSYSHFSVAARHHQHSSLAFVVAFHHTLHLHPFQQLRRLFRHPILFIISATYELKLIKYINDIHI